jgi:hypothetical protein
MGGLSDMQAVGGTRRLAMEAVHANMDNVAPIR